jgi:hypothetical protein
MDRIRISGMQYSNLRKCFRENLVHPILGEDYYNLAMDTYEADRITTEDLRCHFDGLKIACKIFKSLLAVSVIANIFMMGVLIFR